MSSITKDRIFLVTGAAGFTGSHLVRFLLGNNIKVRAMVRSPEQASQIETLGAEAVVADLENEESLEKAVDGIYGIYHIAAAFRKAGIADQKFFDINVEGTKKLFEAGIKAGVKRIIHCSTVGVLSHIEHPPADENTPYKPADVYQESKMQGELLAMNYYASGKISGVVIRPAMIYGPEDMRTLKMFKLISKQRFFYVGKGDGYVHFIDVRDLARSFYLAMEKEQLNNEIYIIAGKKAYQLREVAGFIAKQLGVRAPWIKIPVKPMQTLGTLCEVICKPFGIEPPLYRRRVDFYTKDRYFSSEKAKRDLNFEAAQDIKGELRDTIEWYIANGYITGTNLRNTQPDVVFTRNICGSILHWDENAEKKYGWVQHQAVGNISHTLLQTEFPENLEEINKKLLHTGKWEGHLLHKTKCGKTLAVKSHWSLDTSDDNLPKKVREEIFILPNQSGKIDMHAICAYNIPPLVGMGL